MPRKPSSKDAIITELFRGHLRKHTEITEAGYARTQELEPRLRIAFEPSFDVRREGRTLLGGLAGITLGEKGSSLFSPATEDLRSASQAVFLRAVEIDGVPLEAREVLATALGPCTWVCCSRSCATTASTRRGRTESWGGAESLAHVRRARGTLFSPVLRELQAILAEFH